MDLKQILLCVASADPNVRNPAEAQLAQAAETQYGQFAMALCGELADETSAENSRQIAGLFMKNMLTAQDAAIVAQKTEKWNTCDGNTKNQIRQLCLQALKSPVKSVSHTSAQVLASIGAIDVPSNQWPELLPHLFQNVSTPDVPLMCKIHSLECLGYMCDTMDPSDVAKGTVDQILNTIVDGMRADYPHEMTLAAVTAMCNSLDFTEANFEVQGERDAILSSVCQAAQCPLVSVREKAFECLATIAALYYSKLPSYITNLFQLTVTAIKSDAEEVGQQAIEFWSTVCDAEIEYADDSSVTSFNIISQAAASLIPVILETLSKQSEDADEDSWNIAKAGAACLDAISQTIGDAVVPHVLPFVTAGIQSAEWRVKESAIMAFGMILDGPSSTTLTPIVTNALPVLVQLLQDPSTHVKDTCAWVIGRICEFHTSAITPAIFPHMVTALTLCLDDQSSGVASQACFAVHNLAMACEEQADDKTNVLSSFMPTMLQKLLNVVNRDDWDENNLRSTAYEAVNKMVENSAEDMLEVVGQVLNESCSRLEKTFTDNMEQQERMTLQANLCSLIGVCINKLPENNVKSYSDRIMQSVLMVFNTKGSVAHEDAFLAIGYLSGKLEQEFGTRYVKYLMPPLLLGMQNTEEYAVCLVAVGVAGDLCRALGKGIAPYSDDIMRCTLEILRSESVNRTVKPHAISLFADAAMALEDGFEKYCSVVLGMLAQASSVDIPPDCDDEDQIDYINVLRESILEAYTGVVQGLKDGKKEHNVVPAIDSIVTLIHKATSDKHCVPAVLKASIALLGDLGNTFGNRMLQIFSQAYILQLLQEGQSYEDMREIVQWTNGIVQSVRSGKHP